VELSTKRPAELRSLWDDAREQPREGLRLLSVIASPLPVILLLAMGYARRWVAEDAFINFRVVQHLLAGHGPVFNSGERVEAFTSPAWLGILTAWAALRGPLEIGSLALGLLLSGIGLALAQAGAWRLAQRLFSSTPDGGNKAGDGRIALPLGALTFAAIPVVWDFTTSGLESGLTMTWLGGVFWLLARARPMTARGARLAALAISCGPLVRPDLLLFSLGFAAALAAIVRSASADRPTARRWLELVVIAAALPVGYQVFRMGYFAALVPTTALAKEASAAYWTQGWQYTLDFVEPYALWLPLAVATAWSAGLLWSARGKTGGHGDAALVAAPMLCALLHALYVTRVGGDFMHGRLLLPSLLGFLLPVATVLIPTRAARLWRVALLAAVGGWVVACAIWLRVPYADHSMPGLWGIADERGFYTHHMHMSNPIYLADYLRHPYVKQLISRQLTYQRVVAFDRPDEVLVVAGAAAPSVSPSARMVLGLSNVGILGYAVGPQVHVVDRLGLGDPVAARLALTERGRPGHEKMLSDAWIVARFGAPEIARSGAARDAAQALGCGDLARLLQAVTAPLTPSRFFANIREAWTFHRVRIPGEPAAARLRFCGPAGA